MQRRNSSSSKSFRAWEMAVPKMEPECFAESVVAAAVTGGREFQLIEILRR
jgi:hypothetical protein